MLFTVLLLSMQSGAEMVAAQDQAHAAYSRCVSAETLRLGAGNQETADTILKAAEFKCAPQWQALEASFAGLGALTGNILAKWHREAEGAAIAGLLEARAGAK